MSAWYTTSVAQAKPVGHADDLPPIPLDTVLRLTYCS